MTPHPVKPEAPQTSMAIAAIFLTDAAHRIESIGGMNLHHVQRD
jgi:hypothetical protein